MFHRKLKSVSLAVKSTQLVSNCCVLCKTGLVGKDQKTEFTLGNVGKLIDIAFTLRKVFSVTDEWIQSAFTKVFQGPSRNANSELLLCSECLTSVVEITKVVEDLVELSGDIVNLKRKLFPCDRNRRLLLINCDEEIEQSSEPHLANVEDPLGGDDFREPLEASENESESEEPAPKRPCIKRTVAKMKAQCSGVSRRKDKRSNQIDSYSKLLCPCCKQTFPMNRKVGGRTKNNTYANLCRHLVSCPDRTPTLQCDKCVFQSEDIRLFCEHLGACEGEPRMDVIPINKRIIICELCSEGTYFSFEAYFRHCVYHRRYSYKCLFPDPSSPSGICSQRFGATTRSKHWAKHIADPMAAHIPPDDRFKLEIKVPSLYWFCHLCNNRFLTEEARNAHFSSEHSFECKRTHQCNFCASSFLILEDLSTHSILEHPEYAEGISFQVKCDLCGDIFKSKKGLQQHIKSTHENRAIPCSKCGELFNSQKDYMNHMKTHGLQLQLRDLRYLCPECNLPFQQPVNLTSHRIREHKKTDLGPDPLMCIPCKKLYTSKSSLQSHISYFHERKSLKCCEKCGKELATKGLLKQHLFNVHGEGDPPTFKCEYSECGKTFSTKQLRSNHYASQHLKTPSISCEQCGQSFYQMKHFQLHAFWHRHPGFRAFTCELCPTRRFKLSEHVKVHWRTHTPEEQAYLKDFGIRKEEMEEFRAVYRNQKEPNPECYEKTKDGGILLGKKIQGRVQK